MTWRTTSLLWLALSVWCPAAAVAQDQPAVFIHGFAAAGSDWEATANRLRQVTAIEPHVPTLPWRETYDQQAVHLHHALGNLPASTVAVAHSNGGIIAREWSKHRPLGGIVTIGTPHRGVPLMAAMHRWVGFNAETPSLLNAALNAFTMYTDVTWVWSFVEEAVSWASDFSFWSVVDLAAILGFETMMPVAPQMRPYSPYIADLNSPGNLSREAAAVPNRVGIVSIAHNFFWAGPARAAVPEHADQIATVLYAAASSFLFWGAYIQTTSPWDDFFRFEQATTLLSIGSHLMAVDPYYCRVVSRWDLSACFPNDGVVPDESQRFPFAPNLVIGGPAHTQEKEQGTDALREALVWYLHVPERAGSPDQSPPPSGGSGPSAPSPGSAGTLVGGDQLQPGDYMRSPDGRFTLVFQSDGNLVLYDAGGSPRWDSRTRGIAPGRLSMQFDGNLVIYDAWDGEAWSTGTDGYTGAYLAVLNDGDVVVFDQDGALVWRTGTGS